VTTDYPPEWPEVLKRMLAEKQANCPHDRVVNIGLFWICECGLVIDPYMPTSEIKE
jgi:hypothetical protein